MEINKILAELDTEIERLQQAKAATTTGKRRQGSRSLPCMHRTLTISGRSSSITKPASAKARSRRYVECAERGTGFSDLSQVEVRIDDNWVPLEQAATLRRKARAARIKQEKASGQYVWQVHGLTLPGLSR